AAGGVVGPIGHVVAVRRLVSRACERAQRPAGVEQFVVENVGHGPAGTATRAHQVRLTEPARHGGHVPVRGVEGIEYLYPVQVAHPAILWPGTDTGTARRAPSWNQFGRRGIACRAVSLRIFAGVLGCPGPQLWMPSRNTVWLEPRCATRRGGDGTSAP